MWIKFIQFSSNERWFFYFFQEKCYVFIFLKKNSRQYGRKFSAKATLNTSPRNRANFPRLTDPTINQMWRNLGSARERKWMTRRKVQATPGMWNFARRNPCKLKQKKHYLANLSSKFLISDWSSLLEGISREGIFLAQLINMLSEFSKMS